MGKNWNPCRTPAQQCYLRATAATNLLKRKSVTCPANVSCPEALATMARVGILSIFCLLVFVALSSALLLDRLPRRDSSVSRNSFAYQDPNDEDDDFTESEVIDSSTDDKRNFNFESTGMNPSWQSFYPFPPDMHGFRNRQRKREALETSEKNKLELTNILKDEDEGSKNHEDEKKKKKTNEKDMDRKKGSHVKAKRQSSDDETVDSKLPELKALVESAAAPEAEENPTPNPEFQDWLRREYYRNMAKSFASMRRKRDGSSAFHHKQQHLSSSSARAHNGRPKKSVSFEEVTDNLRAIEDVLFLDALQTLREAGDDYEEDSQRQNRITNDLSSAYDLETMRNALFHLRETLSNLEQPPPPPQQPHEVDEETFYKAEKKRSEQCPALDLLTSDCSALADVVSDGPLKRLLLHACNWHEVCYTCGEVYGLTAENCDVGFVEQSQTICRGDTPCESTASLLLLPLRQRRVFYKRSNPSVCLVDACVQAFLKDGQ